MPTVPYALIFGTTGTSGTGPFVVTAAAGSRALSSIPNGTEVPYMRFDSSAAFEEGLATVSTSGGVTTFTRVGSPHSSSNSGAAVNWPPAATQNVEVGPTAGTYVTKQNAGSEYAGVAATFRAYLGILSGALITAEQAGIITFGWSGGTNFRVQRYSAADTFVDASNTDTVDQLYPLVLKHAGGYYLPGSLVPMTGLTAGSIYYLSTSGQLTATRPTESATVRVVPLGKAISATSLLFYPGMPIGK
jgi:hypothetical protein